jgi:hypothetical protein
VVIKTSVFWDLTPCSWLKVSWRFAGKCRFHFQVRKVSFPPALILVSFMFLFSAGPWRWRWLVPLKHRFILYKMLWPKS